MVRGVLESPEERKIPLRKHIIAGKCAGEKFEVFINVGGSPIYVDVRGRTVAFELTDMVREALDIVKDAERQKS